MIHTIAGAAQKVPAVNVFRDWPAIQPGAAA
jgi:hypothetical protein